MDHMKEIATEMFGLDWDYKKQESESFLISQHSGTFKITCNGLYVRHKKAYLVGDHYTFSSLISGNAIMVKFPWKPKVKEEFWTFNLTNTFSDIWHDVDVCNRKYSENLVYRTEEEAQENFDKVKEFIKGLNQ